MNKSIKLWIFTVRIFTSKNDAITYNTHMIQINIVWKTPKKYFVFKKEDRIQL